MIDVAHTTEFERVAALPRRVLTRADAEEWAAFLTPRFALRADVALRPWQAVSIAEAVGYGGAWLALPVGVGKTLISALLPGAMGSERALLIVPASLVNKTRADFESYVGAWRMGPPCLIATREKLATIGGADLLTEYRPDLILLDEADDLSNARSAAARRIDRYVRANDVRVVAMTGTPARKSILNYWHLLAWTLGDRAPVPLVHEEATTWALALDERRGGPGASPGPLGATVRSARAWYRRRLVETPGVVVVDEDSCDAPLTIRVRLAREDAVLDAAFERFLVEQESPGGIPVSDPLSRWLLDAQLGLGLYTRWNPAPPDEWRDARRAVARFVRERIDASTRAAKPLDTEAQVLRAYANAAVVKDWVAAKPLFDGATETVWISRSAIDSCLDWLHELRDAGVPGIVWTGSVDFGRALASEAGVTYYGQRGQSDNGAELHAAPPGVSLVASWAANKKGFNLQAWPRQLVTMPPQSAKWLEQIFGRSHRSGQRDAVVVDVLATSGGTLDTFDAAINEARMVRDTVGLTQKVLRADVVRARPTLTDANAYRWARKD